MKRWTILLAATALSGCATFHQAADMNAKAKAEAEGASAYYPKVVKTTPAPFLMGPPVHIAPPPNPLLLENVTLVTAQPLSIRELAGRITDITGVPVRVTGLSIPSSGLDAIPALPAAASAGALPPPPAALFSAASSDGETVHVPSLALRYHGTLRGLLDTITARAGLSWRLKHGVITLFKIESRTFLIPALPTTTTTESKIVASAGATSSSGALGLSSGGGGGSGGNSSNGNTSITNKSTTDIWKGMEKTAEAVSGGAKVTADASSGTITVTGTPDQVSQVASWVSTLQQTLSKQVAITIHIYNVQLTNEQNYGFNPTLAFQNAAKSFGLSLAGAPAPAVASGTSTFSFGASILNTAQGSAGEFAGTQAAVQALATLGHVSQVFSQSRVTLNGEPAAIQVAQQTGYLAESQINQAANVGSTTGLIPGTVTTGFTGTVTPRVVGNRILLGMNMTISSLVNLKTVSSGGASIQVPTTTDTVVNQSASLRSGSTLMITGYKEADGNTTNNGVGTPFFTFLGGGGDAQVKKTLIAIVVSARSL
ncbi:secretin N-terminal domain-containing protein [Acidiphilium acidophilum]|uniref:Secretin N-terminal domain-containing protein n=1 Tax=Acidiphilium acidophilum TaxID=76588 RepID=A0AAW9DKG2_ACIAO|nr:secretin N-terminal domain-containing protein [Acidiphilium acidophilum]MDX5929471.1 secretin N-terminal domain-containing protein [Acidiphilium acidophilum]